MKTPEKSKLELHLLLPEISDVEDTCVGRLISVLLSKSGLERAHVDCPERSQPMLCVHFDAAVITATQLREMAQSQGAAITKQYGHYVMHLTTPPNARGARLWSDRLSSIEGVVRAEVSPLGATRVEFQRSMLSIDQLAREIAAVGGKLGHALVAVPVGQPETIAARWGVPADNAENSNSSKNGDAVGQKLHAQFSTTRNKESS